MTNNDRLNFKFWCQKVLPTVYDESLSYYEVLCKLTKHMSELSDEMAEVKNGWEKELHDWLAENGIDELVNWINENGEAILAEWLEQHFTLTESSLREQLASTGSSKIILGNDITVSSPLIVSNENTTIDLNGYTLIKGFQDNTGTELFVVNDIATGEDVDDYYYRVKDKTFSIRNGIIDMNRNDGYVFGLGQLYNATFENLTIRNANNGMFKYYHTTENDDTLMNKKGGNNRICNVRLNRNIYITTNAIGEIGIDINFNDSVLDDCYVVMYQYGVWVRGSNNIIMNCHPWGMPRSSYTNGSGEPRPGGGTYPLGTVMRVGFICTAYNNKFIGCISDSPDFGGADATATSNANISAGGIGYLIATKYVEVTNCKTIPHDKSTNKRLVGIYCCDHYISYQNKTEDTTVSGYVGNINITACTFGNVHEYGGSYIYPKTQFAYFVKEDVPCAIIIGCNTARGDAYNPNNNEDVRNVISDDKGVTMVYTNAMLSDGLHYSRLGQQIPQIMSVNTTSDIYPYRVIERLFGRYIDPTQYPPDTFPAGVTEEFYAIPTGEAIYGNTIICSCLYEYANGADNFHPIYYIPSRGRWIKFNTTTNKFEPMEDTRANRIDWRAPKNSNGDWILIRSKNTP